jgi:hypothetical protein
MGSLLGFVLGVYFHIVARRETLEFPGALYHIISRGNAEQEIFLDVADRRNAGAYRARLYLLGGVANLELKVVTDEFGISTTSVSRM